MPRVKTAGVLTPQPATWEQTITDRIQSGQLVPIVSGAACYDLMLGGQEALLDAYTQYGGIQVERRSLPYMTQVRRILDERISDERKLREDYVNFVKNRLYDLAEAAAVDPDVLAAVAEQFDYLSFLKFCNELDYPRFDQDTHHPLLVLAALPLPIYITTDYHGFLEMALRYAGKTPCTELCRWHNDLRDLPSALADGFEPTAQTPLVYHLHGFDEYPDSLVLAEDDFLKFLVACTQNVGRDTDPIPKRIRRAMSDSSLMLLGYGLSNWDFRSLFWGLIEPRTRRLTSVLSIQLEPSDLEERYYQKYFARYDFNVFWGSMPAYMQKLYQQMTS